MTVDPSRKLAKDVATELQRRKRRNKVLVLSTIATLVILAIMYLRCGGGWGLGKGSGEGTGSAKALVARDAGPRRCALRIDAKGISVDGAPATRAKAVAACKKAGGAEVVVTGDATQGVWDELRAALDAAKVPSYLQRK